MNTIAYISRSATPSGGLPSELQRKLNSLASLVGSMGRIAIAFSGGVDSTFLAEVCARALPCDDIALLHLETPLIGSPERASFQACATDYASRGVRVITLRHDPLSCADVAANPADRCYHCKLGGFRGLLEEASRRGYETLLEGSNADDAGDYRPGMRAIHELGVKSPLMDTGWHKEEEREVLRIWGCAVWNLPAGACLATRIPCGEPLTLRKLEIVRSCEDHLHAMGLRQVRVRLDGGSARVSTDEEGLALLRERFGSHALPDDALHALCACGAKRIDPVVHLYAHGETSVRS